MSFDYSAWLDGIEAEFAGVLRAPNTFRRSPEPANGFIDARRDDGCVPVITEVP